MNKKGFIFIFLFVLFVFACAFFVAFYKKSKSNDQYEVVFIESFDEIYKEWN